MNQIKVGWGKRDISTEEPIGIPGQFHLRISKGVSDPLNVTVLILDDGIDSVIFLSIDAVAIRSNLCGDIKQAVKNRNSQIPVDKILMNVTHTHEGASHYFSKDTSLSFSDMPDVGIKIASSDEYRSFLASKAAEAVCDAYDSRKPGGISYGYGYAVAGHSRRVIYFDDISKRSGSISGFMVDGHGKMYGNTNDDNFSHYEAGADHFINFLFTFDTNEKMTGAIINIPCPSQCSEFEYKLSADYWNEVRIAVKEKFGNIFILPQCAAAGDLSPRILYYKKAQERRFLLKYGGMEHTRAERSDIAERIVQSFEEVYSWAKKDIKNSLVITHVVKTLKLARRRITDEEYAFALQKLEEMADRKFITEGDAPDKLIYHNSRLISERRNFKQIIDRYKEQNTEPHLPTDVHVVKVGDIAFASNQFELYMDFMHRIQARSPFEQTFVIQLAGTTNNNGTYLATERGAVSKGYSASLFCNLVSPEGGQQLVDETVRILKDIYSK